MRQDPPPSSDIIRELLRQGRLDAGGLKAAYRRLSKQAHPDLTGRDGSAFVRLQGDYEEAREYLRRLSSALPDAGCDPEAGQFSPTTVLEELGLPVDSEPRAALYASLYRYTVAGLHDHRARSRLGRRGRRIIRTVLYWAALYAPGFVAVFVEYNKVHAIRYQTYLSNRRIVAARRMFLRGLHWALQYQDRGRWTACRAAADRLAEALVLLGEAAEKPGLEAMAAFASWLLEELDLPPVRLGLEG